MEQGWLHWEIKQWSNEERERERERIKMRKAKGAKRDRERLQKAKRKALSATGSDGDRRNSAFSAVKTQKNERAERAGWKLGRKRSSGNGRTNAGGTELLISRLHKSQLSENLFRSDTARKSIFRSRKHILTTDDSHKRKRERKAKIEKSHNLSFFRVYLRS